jgi:hypothetical protein
MEHLTLRTETDTATPRQGVPIYFIHTIPTPLCKRPGCWCQTNKATIAHLVAAISNDELMLHEAASFTENKTV